MSDCIFCKIVAGEIPAATVYEDDMVISFLDIVPANKGHCLVIPKKHHETLLDTPEEALASMMKAVKKVAKALSLSVGNGAYNVIMNNGAEAGQVVAHVHVHLIPRFRGDGQDLNWKSGKYADKEMEEIRENIRKFIEQ